MTGKSRTAMALLASLALASPAIADPRPPTDKDKQLASDLVKKAIAKSQAGDHNAAIDLYLKAFTIVPNSILLSNIGSEYQHSDRPQQALRYFCMYLEKDPSGTNAPYAAAQAKALQIELGNTEVDDRDVCAKPRPKPRPRLEPREPPIETEAEGGPGSRPPLPPEPVKAESDSSTATTLRYVGLGAGGLGAIAAGVGIYAGIQAKEISDEITAQGRANHWSNDIQDLQDRGQRYENIQVASLIAGGALITGGVVLYVISRSSDRSTDKPQLTVAPTTNGFVVAGRF